VAIYLKKVRLDLDMTQEELAKKVNLNRATISMLESSRRKGSITTWDKLEAVLGVDQKALRKEEKA
jgi:DNA-binding XRE family transcriptional regulator